MNVQINKESGFRNFAPKGREYRNLQNDKHLLERTRLAKRKEGFQRHEPCTNPLFVKETAAGYCPGILHVLLQSKRGKNLIGLIQM